MQYCKVKSYIHSIWHTKNSVEFLTPDICQPIYKFMYSQFENLKCPSIIINGTPDHIHCLFLQNQTKTLAEIIKQVKGTSSRFINENNLVYETFAWQRGYGAFSVSESQLNNCINYIKFQKSNNKGNWI